MAFVNMNPNGWSNLYVNVGTHTGMQPEVVADTLYFLLVDGDGDGDGDSSCSAATSPTDFSVYFSFIFKRTHIMYAFLSNNQIKSKQNAVFFSLTLAHSFFSISFSFRLMLLFLFSSSFGHAAYAWNTINLPNPNHFGLGFISCFFSCFFH